MSESNNIIDTKPEKLNNNLILKFENSILDVIYVGHYDNHPKDVI